MRTIRLTNAAHVDAFCAFLRAVQVHIDAVEGTLVRAALPGAPSPLHERRELDGYVVTWNALNPGRQVELVEAPGADA